MKEFKEKTVDMFSMSVRSSVLALFEYLIPCSTVMTYLGRRDDSMERGNLHVTFLLTTCRQRDGHSPGQRYPILRICIRYATTGLLGMVEVGVRHGGHTARFRSENVRSTSVEPASHPHVTTLVNLSFRPSENISRLFDHFRRRYKVL